MSIDTAQLGYRFRTGAGLTLRRCACHGGAHMGKSRQPRDQDAGSGARAEDVLHYWLASLRIEEALQNRPRARRSPHGSATPRLDFPALGQAYFKQPLNAESTALLGERAPLRRAFDGELAAFFESFLYTQYRRGQDESELSHLLCFPVVQLPRGELAGLLRYGVRLGFSTSDGTPFRVPSRAERQRGSYPAPPSVLSMAPAPRSEGALPFFIDTRLLSHPLGLSSDEIDSLFELLREHGQLDEAAMLTIVAQTLERVARGDSAQQVGPATTDDPRCVLERLRLAMQRLLGGAATRAQVYPVGIVVDATQAKTTWHLQRELESLLDRPARDVTRAVDCLHAYLTRQPLAAGEAPQRALFPGPSLTRAQRRAAELFWGSPLSSVQGPPGTGKTTLILHLCAEALVRQVESLLDGKGMGSALLLVTSSNNRAVDNVIEPLTSEALPLALRVGSRQVCEHRLAPQLRRTLAWLAQAEVTPLPLREQSLAQALAAFASVRDELEPFLAPRRLALAQMAERERLRRAIAALPKARNKESASASLPKLSAEAARTIERSLDKLERRLLALSELCAEKPGMAQVNAIARHYEKTAQRDLPPLEDALRNAGLPLEVPLPPLATPLDVEALMEVWEEGTESFLTRLAALRVQVAATLLTDKLAREAEQLHAQLGALGREPEAPPPASGGHDALSRALFAAALCVREAWARAHAAELGAAVDSALRSVEQECSLRPLFRSQPNHASALCSLFGVWGSTLLSLGNCLPAESGSVSHVVIDEAGQCHPAHAVSALLRCGSALIIGDVHQLTPIIELREEDDARLLRAPRLSPRAEALDPYRVHSKSLVSAQSLAAQAVQTCHALVDHFRCQPEIIAISDALCGYGLTVHTPSHVGRSWLAHPVSLIDLRGQQERYAGTLCNELELQETVALVALLLARGATPSELAVITPYRGQLERLRRALLDQRVPLEYSAELADSDDQSPSSGAGLALGTVHRFQGGERSVVLFSSVVTEPSSLAFLNARPNLLNVAVSRAQHHFVCLGDRSVLLQGPRTRLLVEAASPLAASAARSSRDAVGADPR